MIIGITGKSGSGKTTYANKLSEENGYTVVHIDENGHAVLERDDVQTLLMNALGDNCVANGVVNRKCIGEMIFTNRHLYNDISDFVWSAMKVEIDAFINSNPNIILDWILLPHTHYWKMCDTKILMVADEEDRKRRVMARDNISAEYLSKRDSAGISYDGIEFDQIIYTTKEKTINEVMD